MNPQSLRFAHWRVIALTIVVASTSGCGPSAQTPETEATRPAFVTEVRAVFPGDLVFTGEIRSTRRAELAFAVSGRVQQVLVEPGDAVRQGEVLAQLDVLPLNAELVTASAELRRGEAQLNEVRQRMDRLRVAQESNAISATEAGAVLAELASAEALVRSARARREAAAWSLDQATLRAPLAGIIATRNLEPGQYSGPGVAAISIDGAGRELALLVPGDFPLKAGQPVGLRDGTTQLNSKVLRVGGRLEAGGVRKITVTAPDSAVVGSTWSVALDPGATRAVAWAPLRAVLPANTPGTGSVLRVAEDGCTTVQVAVKLGVPRGDWIEVTEGLVAGDRVVVAGAESIRPGTVIKPVAMAALETRP